MIVHHDLLSFSSQRIKSLIITLNKNLSELTQQQRNLQHELTELKTFWMGSDADLFFQYGESVHAKINLEIGRIDRLISQLRTVEKKIEQAEIDVEQKICR